MPSMSTSMVSPGFTFLVAPGVPVKMMSPGVRVTYLLV